MDVIVVIVVGTYFFDKFLGENLVVHHIEISVVFQYISGF